MANRLYAQYRTKPRMEAWSDIPKDFGTQITQAAQAVRDMWDIDNNSGEQLNVIGRIVQRDRSYIANLRYETYELNTDGDNEAGDDEVQLSPAFGADDDDLSERYYRLLLKAKIAKNNDDGTIDGILSAIKIIAPEIDVLRLTDGEDMTFSIEFYGLADPVTRDLLISGEIIPRPQSVLFRGFLEGFNMVELNNDGDFECGDENAQCVGFIGA